METSGNLVAVASFRDVWDAHIAQGRLHAEDLAAFLVDENIIWINWTYSQAIGGVKLWVPADTAHRAIKVLGALRMGEYAELLEDYEPVFDTGPCPNCDAADPKPVFSMQDLLLLVCLGFFLGLIFPAHRSENRCGHCANVWDRDLKA